MSSWMKAGLIGGAIVVVLNLLGLLPYVGCITWLVSLLAYAGIGVLAAYWLPPRREAGPGAGQGALAAGLAAAIGGIVYAIAVIIQVQVIGYSEIISQLPPDMLQQVEQAGMDPNTLAAVSGVLGGAMCCAGAVIVGVILGAIGGAIFAGLRPE